MCGVIKGSGTNCPHRQDSKILTQATSFSSQLLGCNKKILILAAPWPKIRQKMCPHPQDSNILTQAMLAASSSSQLLGCNKKILILSVPQPKRKKAPSSTRQQNTGIGNDRHLLLIVVVGLQYKKILIQAVPQTKIQCKQNSPSSTRYRNKNIGDARRLLLIVLVGMQ